MAVFRPSGISVFIRQDLVAGSSRSGTTLNIDPIITKAGTRVTMAHIGDIGYAKIDPGKSTEEIISFTGMTDNTTTYQLTGVTWGYQFHVNTGDVDANKKKHTSGASIIITNDDHWLSVQFVNVDDAQTIAGIKTFSALPAITAGNPVADNDVARKAYVDSVVAGSFPADRLVVAGTGGATIADGDLIYFDTTDDEWKLCDADTAATVDNVLLGIAQGAGTDGAAISNGVLLKGVDDAQAGMTIGDVMYASNTAGDIASSAGTEEVVVGIAKSATELYFSPRFSLMLTGDQQDALAGNLGTPSSADLLVTQTGLQKGAEVYAADAEASDTYVITLSPVPASLYTGMVINFKANTANTGAATLNINSLGAKNILKHNDKTLETGDIEAGQIITVVYDGTSFQMQSQVGTNGIAPGNSYLLLPTNEDASTTVSFAANTTKVSPITIPYKMTITKVYFEVTSGHTAGRYVGVGVYSADGNTRHIDTGPQDIVSSGVKVVTLGASVTLNSGPYLLAVTESSGSVILRSVTLGTTAPLLNAGADVYGLGNVGSAGQLPATLGTITGETTARPQVVLSTE